MIDTVATRGMSNSRTEEACAGEAGALLRPVRTEMRLQALSRKPATGAPAGVFAVTRSEKVSATLTGFEDLLQESAARAASAANSIFTFPPKLPTAGRRRPVTAA